MAYNARRLDEVAPMSEAKSETFRLADCCAMCRASDQSTTGGNRRALCKMEPRDILHN